MHSLVNVVGLSAGVAFCLLAWRFIACELSFDSSHSEADRIFRVTRTIIYPDREWKLGTTQDFVAGAMADDFPQVVRTARLICNVEMDTRLFRTGQDAHRLLLAWADPAILEVFAYPVVEGDPQAALERPDQAVISHRAARLLFDGPAAGRTLSLRKGEGWLDWEVGAVVAVPRNSTFRFDVLDRFADGPQRGGSYVHTFVELADPGDGSVVQAAMSAFTEHHSRAKNKKDRYGLQPLPAIHLDPSWDYTPNTTSATYCWILAAIAAAVLLVACANFVNLSIAMAADRFREVGLRRTLGAHRSQVARQFLVEGLLHTAVSLAAGTALAELAAPGFGAMVGRVLSSNYGVTATALALLGVVTALVIGGCPALILSRPRPATLFREEQLLRGSSPLARMLVFVQLGASVVLVTGAAIVSQQMDFLLTMDMGFEREQVVVLNGRNGSLSKGQNRALRSRLHDLAVTHPEIVSSSGSWYTMGQDFWRGVEIRYQPEIRGEEAPVDYDFVETLGLRLRVGRGFSRDFPGDVDGSVVVNESLVRAFGWDSALGRTFEYRRTPVTVIGVVEDFHLNNLYREISPLLLQLAPDGHLRNVYVRIASGNIRGALGRLERAWDDVAPDVPFDYTFLDDDVARQYRDEQRWGHTVRGGAGLAIGIAALGALALASLAATRRTREIGIRKVLGATAADVVALLSREFVWLGLVASAAGCPAAYVACGRWLESFAYRIPLNPLPFAVGCALVVGGTLAVVAGQALRASRLNPVEAMRYE